MHEPPSSSNIYKGTGTCCPEAFSEDLWAFLPPTFIVVVLPPSSAHHSPAYLQEARSGPSVPHQRLGKSTELHSGRWKLPASSRPLSPQSTAGLRGASQAEWIIP